MRAVVQRVKNASVSVSGEEVSSIGDGLLILAGFHRDDGESDADYIIRKCIGLRIFDDSDNFMNLSIKETGGDILIVSQFTLYGDTRKGKRPSFSEAMNGEKASIFYQEFLEKFEHALGKPVKSGLFGENMEVNLANSGPVTIIIESPKS